MGDKSNPVMFVRQAAELDYAFGRNGWSPEDVKKLSAGDTLARILPVIRGLADVVVKEHMIDLDANPFIPNGYTVEEHRKGGQFAWDPTKVQLHLSPNQKGRKVIEGNKLRTELVEKNVFNANLLDFLLAHPHLIPEEWREKAVFFWGTVYRNAGGDLVVRSLYWGGGRWISHVNYLALGWFEANPALVRA